MRTRRPSERTVELTIGGLTIISSTLAFLIASPALGAIALVTGGMSYGIAIARRADDR